MSKETEINLKEIVTNAIKYTIIEYLFDIGKNNPVIVFDDNDKLDISATYDKLEDVVRGGTVWNGLCGGCEIPMDEIIYNIDDEIYEEHQEEIDNLIEDMFMDILGDL